MKHLILHILEKVKYLGITIQNNLNGPTHQLYYLNIKPLHSLGFLCRNLKNNSVKVKEHAYKAIVKPKLEYASTIEGEPPPPPLYARCRAI